MIHPLNKAQVLKVQINQVPTILLHKLPIRIFQARMLLVQDQTRMLPTRKFRTL